MPLDLLGREQPGVGLLDRVGDRLQHGGLPGEGGRVAASSPCALGERRRPVGVEHQQRDVVGPVVADRHGLADELARALQLRLDVRRRHVLAGGADDQLLLAVDDRQVAVLVELADVAGAVPAVGVDRRGGLLRLVAVAAHQQRAAHQDLAVVVEPELDAGDAAADRAHAWPRRRVRGRDRRARTCPRPRTPACRARGRTPAPAPGWARHRPRTARPGQGRARPAPGRRPRRPAGVLGGELGIDRAHRRAPRPLAQSDLQRRVLLR